MVSFPLSHLSPSVLIFFSSLFLTLSFYISHLSIALSLLLPHPFQSALKYAHTYPHAEAGGRKHNIIKQLFHLHQPGFPLRHFS